MNAIRVARGWMVKHPGQTVLHVINGVVIFTPAAATVPIFWVLGLSATGPDAGGAAAAITSFFGVVPAGGLVATIQSAAMGGYGASMAAGLAQAGAATSSAAAACIGVRRGYILRRLRAK